MNNHFYDMKILHLIWNGKLGGAEKFALDLANNQKKNDNVVCMGVMSRKLDIGILCDTMNIPVVEFMMSNGFDIISHICYLRFVSSYSPNVIHNHGSTPLAYFTKIHNRKVVFIDHIHGTTLGDDKWVKKRVLFTKRMADNFIDHYLVNSHYTRRIVLEKEKILPEKISVLYNGIDLTNFRPIRDKNSVRKEFGFHDSDKIVGTVGRLHPQKGIDRFIDVAKEVANLCQNVRFMIVGDGELRSTLESRVKELHLQDKIIFTGARFDIPDILSIFDLFLLTSNWEPFGIVLLEAMAVGVPVIAFAVGGVSEVVDHTCAILVSPGDVKTMSHEVITLLREKTRRDDLIRNGLVRVRRFDIKRISKCISRLYASFVQNK